MAPSNAEARFMTSASLSTQSRDIEAELQQLIQSRRKDGQALLPELQPRNRVRRQSTPQVT